MTQLSGYIQRRAGSLTPNEQRVEIIKSGVVEHSNPKDTPIYDTLDEVFHPLTIRKGDRLHVWELAIIGLGNINKAFVEIGKLGGEGIYDIKDKAFYPCHEVADKKHARARAAIVKANSKVRAENSAGKSGKPPSDAWEHQDHIIHLHNKGKHPADLAIDYGVSRSTIDRILK